MQPRIWWPLTGPFRLVFVDFDGMYRNHEPICLKDPGISVESRESRRDMYLSIYLSIHDADFDVSLMETRPSGRGQCRVSTLAFASLGLIDCVCPCEVVPWGDKDRCDRECRHFRIWLQHPTSLSNFQYPGSVVN